VVRDGWEIAGFNSRKELQIMCLSRTVHQTEQLTLFRERRVLAVVKETAQRRKRRRMLLEKQDVADDVASTASLGGFLSPEEAEFSPHVPGLQPVEVVDLVVPSSPSSTTVTSSTTSSPSPVATATTTLGSWFGFGGTPTSGEGADHEHDNDKGSRMNNAKVEDKGVEAQEAGGAPRTWMSFETAEHGPHADDPTYGKNRATATAWAREEGDGTTEVVDVGRFESEDESQSLPKAEPSYSNAGVKAQEQDQDVELSGLPPVEIFT